MVRSEYLERVNIAPLILVILAVLTSGFIFQIYGEKVSNGMPNETATSAKPTKVTWVNWILDTNSTVKDLLITNGTTTASANLSRVTLASLVIDTITPTSDNLLAIFPEIIKLKFDKLIDLIQLVTILFPSGFNKQNPLTYEEYIAKIMTTMPICYRITRPQYNQITSFIIKELPRIIGIIMTYPDLCTSSFFFSMFII
ncbi:unnamed protein product [Gordionus sp. m RMFG-2023]